MNHFAGTTFRLPTFGRFFRWWFAELGALAGGGKGTPGFDDAVLVDVSSDDVVVIRRKGRRATIVARLDGATDDRTRKRLDRVLAGRAPVILHLAEGSGLCRVIHLPPAATSDLDAIVAFEIGRRTPFSPSDVVHDHAVLDRDGPDGRLRVRLVVVPRAVLTHALDRLGDWPIEPAALELPLVDGGRATLVLDRGRLGPHDRKAGWRRDAFLALLVVALGCALAGVHLERRSAVRVDLLRSVEAAKAEASDALALREAVAAAHRDATALASAKRARPATIEALDELSRALPDGSWLTRLEIKGDRLEILGESESAADLVAILDASPMLTDVALRSPVTPTGDGQGERFHIGARLVGSDGQ
jgi:general secretion pathway protein L